MRKEGPAASPVLKTAPKPPSQGLFTPSRAPPGEPVAPKGSGTAGGGGGAHLLLSKGEMGIPVERAAAEHSVMPKANPTPSRWFPVVYPPGMSITELPSSPPSEETPSVTPSSPLQCCH